MDSDWRERYAEPWARTVLRVLGTEYPYAAGHVSLGPDDVDVTPSRLHPAFHGCLDWHSSVHMQWSAVRLLTLAPEHLTEPTRDELLEVLGDRLTVEAGAAEADYLRRYPRFERPYGWGWAALLAAATTQCPLPDAHEWAAASRSVYDAVAQLVEQWLPNLAYPVRHGEHANTAFGLALVHEAATALASERVRDQIASTALEWFGADRDYPARWEPGGSDFISPALCEADLVRRVMPPDDFAGWLGAFLPDLGTERDGLLSVPEVRDRTDGKAVHLFGLALSRAWQLRLLAPYLPEDRRSRVLDAAARQVSTVEREIVSGDFMATHWLVSFALLAATA